MKEKKIKRKHMNIKLATHSNMALCHLKLNQHAECIRACDAALEIRSKK